jgi:hypothetical protein
VAVPPKPNSGNAALIVFYWFVTMGDEMDAPYYGVNTPK